ncbi:MAG: DNA replication/repair protein RecF [Ruminococcaceae bacterium]|nr:DNA replication/repair protein RecF [Oscillospiraceae bacterium]
MFVSRATYRDWRNITECSVQLDGGINVLWGMNAQGKSNILEGIYYFARGRSFRGAKDREFVRFGADFASAAIDYRRDGYENDTRLEVVIPKNGKKRISRNGAPLSSSAEMMGSFRAVLFCPANLSMVTGGPLERRTFLDIALSQLSGVYLTYLRRYHKVLLERNALIKRAADGQRVTTQEWEVYADVLSECGAWIAAFRQEYTGYLGEAVERYFLGMTEGREVPELRYTSHALYEGIPSPIKDPGAVPDKSTLYEKLTQNVEREVAAGTTLWGTHKDDIGLIFNGREAKAYASQGQQRSIVLSMKLAEAEIAKTVGGEYPVILLDDVFSELDESRRHYILDSLGAEAGRQIIVTSCEPDIIPGNRSEGVNFKHVVAGEVE